MFTNFNLILTTIILTLCNLMSGQSFKITKGIQNQKSKVVTGILGSRVIPPEGEFNQYEISYPVNDKITLSLATSHFFASTNFSYRLDFVANHSSSGLGAGSTRLRRLGLGATYYVYNYRNRVKIGPHFRLEYEKTYGESLGYKPIQSDLPQDDPKFKPCTVYVEAFESSQVVPTVGLRTDIYLFWRITLHGEMFYSWGHHPYQRLYYEHHYNGVRQPTGEWYSDGTLWALTWGISVQLWGEKRQLTKEASWF